MLGDLGGNEGFSVLSAESLWGKRIMFFILRNLRKTGENSAFEDVFLI